MADLTGMMQAAAGQAGGINPREYFNTVLYTGTGSSLGVTGVGFQPDWVWIKERNGVNDHGFYDVVRGVQNQLKSDVSAETVQSTGLTAFGADGFTVGALLLLNTSAGTYVAWNWKANGAGVSNTDGTTTSTVSANTDSGFSIVAYTGTGAIATVGHGIGAAPKFIITKKRSDNSNWATNDPSRANPFDGALLLNAPNAFVVSTTVWNDTAPTSTVFSIATADAVNISGQNYVAYCFAEVAGFSKISSYTGNGSATGPSVTTDFQPTWLLIKRTNTTGDWILLDSARDTANPRDKFLERNKANAEATGNDVDFNSTGFQIKSTSASINSSGDTYIYVCFA